MQRTHLTTLAFLVLLSLLLASCGDEDGGGRSQLYNIGIAGGDTGVEPDRVSVRVPDIGTLNVTNQTGDTCDFQFGPWVTLSIPAGETRSIEFTTFDIDSERATFGCTGQPDQLGTIEVETATARQ